MTRLAIPGLERAFHLDITMMTTSPRTPRPTRRPRSTAAGEDDISDADCLKAFAYLCQAIYNPDAPASMAFNLISPFYDDDEPRLRAARAMAALRAHCSSTGNGRLTQLWIRLINDRQASGETAKVYLARFHRTATRIATMPKENCPSQQLLTGLATSKLSPGVRTAHRGLPRGRHGHPHHGGAHHPRPRLRHPATRHPRQGRGQRGHGGPRLLRHRRRGRPRPQQREMQARH
mmetsp:Transcript_37575/g.118475  ORF Transcript_37575/g.118475 Transcript_37575/m.118475 type:complete len:233 (+) Transcript_37575:237-935(+)